MEQFLNTIYKEIIKLHNTNPNPNPNPKNNKSLEHVIWIRIKGLEKLKLLFDVMIENKNNFKHFIMVELDEYFNKTEFDKKIYSGYLAFKKFMLESYENFCLEQTSSSEFREQKQLEYVKESEKELLLNFKVFIKAPTGFGKTPTYYKIIKQMGLKKILILTPRKQLNRQIVESKYLKFLSPDFDPDLDSDLDSEKFACNILHFSDSTTQQEKNKKIKQIKKYSESNKRFILTSCYQSKDILLEQLKESKISFDLIIFDEAHVIETWEDSEFVQSKTLSKYRIFGSATPTENIESKPNIFGKIIELVKVYELINKKILCNVITVIKKLTDQKHEYHNLKDLIIECMCKYKRKKGIIFVNKQINAQNLYDLMEKQEKTKSYIKPYIYLSGDVDIIDKNDSRIDFYESNPDPCVLIVVGKISFGYDNHWVDFICLGDLRQSDIDIRQILGRGLRWNQSEYPDKVLYLLVPLYCDEFGNYPQNSCLKKYLDYIIGECEQDIIFKADGSGRLGTTGLGDGEKQKLLDLGDDYNGFSIPSDILESYCTTGYNKYTDFIRMLKKNNCVDESGYNKLYELNKSWMCELGKTKDKYPKFNFQILNPNNLNYYWKKEDAKNAIKNAEFKLIESIGKDKFKRSNSKVKMDKIIEIDNKIPPIDLDLYYP